MKNDTVVYYYLQGFKINWHKTFVTLIFSHKAMFGIDEELERLLAEDPGLVMDDLDIGKVHIQSPEPVVQYPSNVHQDCQFQLSSFLTVPNVRQNQVKSLPENFNSKESVVLSLHSEVIPERMTASLSNLLDPPTIDQSTYSK